MNNFSGNHIPSFLVSLQNLEYLNLSYSSFEGKVPQGLGNLSNLQYLNLDWNSLTADDINFVSGLSSLKHLGLSGVDLGKAKNWLHSINMLPSLIELHLMDCSLPSIPLFPNINLTSLAVLNLGNNNFNSTIPRWLFNISNIRDLNLGNNDLQGCLTPEMGNLSLLISANLFSNYLECEIPATLGKLCNIRELYLSFNQFSGDVSGVIHSLSAGCAKHSVQLLDLRDNELSGMIPAALGNLLHLESLRIGPSDVRGPIPATIGRLLYLKALDLRYNKLNGSIPESLWGLSKLEVLDLSGNLLDGTVSEHHLLKLTSLTYLYMSDNLLAFDVTSSWIPPPQLRRIGLSSCKVGPRFPGWLQSLWNISVLEMSNASISDTVPDWFDTISSNFFLLDLSYNQIQKSLPKIRKSSTATRRIIYLHSNMFEGPLIPFPPDVAELDISNNLLLGNIPPEIGNLMTEVEIFSLSNNYLNGAIPNSFCNMRQLRALLLSQNQFSGRLPQCWRKLQKLEVLDFSGNLLSGHIPPSLGSPRQLQSLHLENNSFGGQIPISLRNLGFLETLDLSQNNFSGTIPPWIGEELSNLKALSLHSNKFHGNIPEQLCYLSDLSILNLANNNLTGNIPSCFINFTAMITDERSFEEKEDYPIFQSFSYSDSTYGVYVEKLWADINGIQLQYTRTLRFLISIDLSGNHLVGEIPRELTCLTGLRNLNLSRNNLTGEIPLDIGNLTLLASLDLSRNRLSGPIPTSITNLNYLSYLNLSFNRLTGRIPVGKHLQTLEDRSIYIGNGGLCGPPLSSCLEGFPDGHGHPEQRTKDNAEMLWFCGGFGAGFTAGFIGVCGTLYLKASWRNRCFRLVQKCYDMFV
ncbi:hypothetical protein Tsubulata_006382 [Turnera subulata]|uniref:Disease resistance R13L4/SHOC-2-like LRR domain-containing protein n=1 Tax=Turnera subulata TaxID=218843 RepID=A0A9Q0F1G8_9ROSI|nr:hypothetical protein Tsubulata_006382 [Turnera subulata]